MISSVLQQRCIGASCGILFSLTPARYLPGPSSSAAAITSGALVPPRLMSG
jgi:hypothetical protein